MPSEKQTIPFLTNIAVATPGTPLKVSEASVSCTSFTIQNPRTSDGNLYVSDTEAGADEGLKAIVLTPGDAVTFSVNAPFSYIDITDFWFDAEEATDSFVVFYNDATDGWR